MVKTNHLGALAATAGTLVAVGLVMLMMVVEVRSAEATFPGKHNVGGGGGSFNVTDNTTNDYTPSYSPDGKKIAYRGSGSNEAQARTDEIGRSTPSTPTGEGGSSSPTTLRKTMRFPTRPTARG